MDWFLTQEAWFLTPEALCVQITADLLRNHGSAGVFAASLTIFLQRIGRAKRAEIAGRYFWEKFGTKFRVSIEIAARTSENIG